MLRRTALCTGVTGLMEKKTNVHYKNLNNLDKLY